MIQHQKIEYRISVQLIVCYKLELKYQSKKIKKEKLDSLQLLFLKISSLLLLFSRMNTFRFESETDEFNFKVYKI